MRFGVTPDEVGIIKHISTMTEALTYPPLRAKVGTVVIGDGWRPDDAEMFAGIIRQAAPPSVAVVRSDGSPMLD